MKKSKIASPKIEVVPITSIKQNTKNPRKISTGQLDKLAKSLTDFPEMLHLRPLIVDKKNVIIGGNMRYQAAKKVGMTTVPIIRADLLTPEQVKEFIVKDNVAFGEWDFAELEKWDAPNLADWGLEINLEEKEDATYTQKISTPEYLPKNEKPNVFDLCNDAKMKKLLIEIASAKIPEAEKEFLIKAAARHVAFNYEKIADYYAHSSPEVQKLMESSALVIIDFKAAITNGYVKMIGKLQEFRAEDEAAQ